MSKNDDDLPPDMKKIFEDYKNATDTENPREGKTRDKFIFWIFIGQFFRFPGCILTIIFILILLAVLWNIK